MRVFDFDRALVRRPARSVVNGLRPKDTAPPGFEGIAAEHDAYVAALERAGIGVDILPDLEAFPDSLFVEDAALLFPEGAILLQSAAPSRTGESAALQVAIEERFSTVYPLTEGFIDGGDVLVTPDLVLIGLSQRTDRRGAKALAKILEGRIEDPHHRPSRRWPASQVIGDVYR